MIVIIKWSKAIIFLYSQYFSSEITVDICVFGASDREITSGTLFEFSSVADICIKPTHVILRKNDIAFRSRWLAISINCLFWKCHKGDLLTTKNFNKIHLIYVERKEKRGKIRLLFSEYYISLGIYIYVYIWGFVFNEKTSRLISINASTRGVIPW